MPDSPRGFLKDLVGTGHPSRKNLAQRIQRSITLSLIVPILIALTLATFFTYQFIRLEDQNRNIAKTAAILELCSTNLSYVMDMENDFNRALLSGELAFFRSSELSNSLIPPVLAQLENAIKDDHSHLSRVQAIRSKIDSWNAQSKKIATFKTQTNTFYDLENTNTRKAIIESIRDDFRQMRSHQLTILQREQQSLQQTLKAVSIWGGIATAILVIAITLWLRFRLSRQSKTYIRESESTRAILQRLENIIDAAPLAIVYLSLDEKYVFSNRFHRELLGLESVKGLSLEEVAGELTYSHIKPQINKALNGETTSLETSILRKDNSTVFIKSHYAPSYDLNGQIDGIVAIVEDLSVQREKEKRLRKSEDGLLFALQSAKMGTWEVDLENQTTSCSREMLDLWGIEAEEYDGNRLTLQNKVHPSDLDSMKAAIDYAITHNEIYEREYRIRPTPTCERWVTSRGHLTSDKDSKSANRFAGVIYDITERKARETKTEFLLKSVSAYSNTQTPTEVLEISIGLCQDTFGARSGVLALVDKTETYLNYVTRLNSPVCISSDLEATGISLSSAYAAVDVYRSGNACFVSSRKDRDHRYPETSEQEPNSWIEAFACIPILIQGKTSGILAIVFDHEKPINTFDQATYLAMGELIGQALERIQLSVQTQIERDHFRSFFALSSSGSVEVDHKSGLILEANQRISEISSYPQLELMGMDFSAIIHPDDLPNLKRECENSPSNPSKPWRIESRLVTKDGEIRWGILNGVLIFGQNNLPDKFLIAILDISDLKNTELQLNNAIRTRDQFLSIASHELKTPLTSLQLQIQLKQRDLKRKFPEAFSYESLEKSLLQQYGYVQRIGHLVDDMLDVSRIAEGRLSIRLESFDLCEMVSEVLERFKVTSDAAGVIINLTACETIVGRWDRFRLEQVLVNLLTNAIRYGKGKPVQVRVHENSETAILSVKDQGIGISVDDQERIFKKFERAVSASEISGLGLGLYILSEIVRAHGGDIVLVSAPNQGSEFTLLLPTEPTEDKRWTKDA